MLDRGLVDSHHNRWAASIRLIVVYNQDQMLPGTRVRDVSGWMRIILTCGKRKSICSDC